MHKFTNARSSDAQFRFWGQRRFKNGSVEIETFFEVLRIWIYNQECPELCITDQDNGSYNTQTRKKMSVNSAGTDIHCLENQSGHFDDLEKKKDVPREIGGNTQKGFAIKFCIKNESKTCFEMRVKI